ncbi:unnamed protein product [Rotaria socialis]
MAPKQSKPSPFLKANTWSRTFHSWISKLLDESHQQKTLNLVDLYDLLPEYESINLTEKLENHWFDDMRHHPDNPNLFRATVRTMGWQPFLIGCQFIPQFYFSIHGYGAQMRVAYHGLIYRKILRLSSRSLNNMSSGEIVNLFSNDAGQIEMALQSINFLWIALLDIMTMAVFFWYFVNYIACIAIGYTLMLILLVSLIGSLLVYLRRKVLKVTDERVKTMSEIIKSMRIVKLYCWESAFEKKIRSIRKREIIQHALRLIPETIELLFSNTYVCVTFFMMYAAMWSLDIPFDTRFFTVATCFLTHLKFSIWIFGSSIRHFVNYLAAARRIQTFLLLDESDRDRRLMSESDRKLPMDRIRNDENNIVLNSTKKIVKVECRLQRAAWEHDGLFKLKNIIFDAYPGDLICIIGPVGCGKSSILQSLTGEIPYFDGKVRLRGSFCYLPQEPWIFSSTIKKNILFGKDFDPQLFQRVVSATALGADFAQLSCGMNTLVGDQGVMLSGGQKARVNMARALYRDADIYLLDDPLSAVDVKVSKHIFERSIKNFLCDKICILVTHQIQFLEDATKIIVLENGEMVQTGTYDELRANSSSFNRLLENIHQQKQEQLECPINILRRLPSRCLTSTENENGDASSLRDSQTLETKEKGSVKSSVYIAYLREGVGIFLGVFILISMFSFREVIYVVHGWWLARWSDDEGYRRQNFNNCTTMIDQKINIISSMNETQWNVYRNSRFDFYCGIVVTLLILSLLRIFIVKLIFLNSGRVLHNKMFQRLIRCPISFFDSNPAGRILNRFTKDIAAVDEHLPWNFFDFLNCLSEVIGTILLVSWLNPSSFIPAVFVIIGLLFIRYRFARCSRDLKRLDSTSRSPIYSYLTSTIHGLKVIRSYRAENICLSQFSSLIDDNTRANYLFMTTNRWAAIRFDWITTSFIAIAISMALIVRVTGRQFSAADIALTLSYSLNLIGLLQWTIRQSVELETQMTSVERALEYCKLEQEPPACVSPKKQPPTNWPRRGEILFNDVCMAHSNNLDAPLALRNISLNIQAGEKIGIVGRTGAGKSSFIQSIFRMGTLVNGQILIDNIDISTVGLDDVRRRISIIPQDPVLFTGTMRSNLDRFGDYSDAEIWHALDQVQLKKPVSDVMPNGLQSLVNESGSNLSVGQKQLVCLARAILKKNKILVIDEATANVDNATDELIQRAIREQFKNCTVLTVAHRLRTVIDSDRIMVLGSGNILEFDTPQALLFDAQSQFSSLVQQTGIGEAEHLRILANTAAEFNRKIAQDIVISNENTFEKNNESDPFI